VYEVLRRSTVRLRAVLVIAATLLLASAQASQPGRPQSRRRIFAMIPRLVLSASVAVASVTSGETLTESPKAGSRGLRQLCVHFYVLDETPVSEFDSGIRPQVTEQLARLGVPAVDFTECDRSVPALGSLFITARGAPSASGKFWAYTVSLELAQDATLDRDPTQKLTVTTYQNAVVGVAAMDRLAEALRSASLELTRSFADVYRTENAPR
jgi:hypothetical protein